MNFNPYGMPPPFWGYPETRVVYVPVPDTGAKKERRYRKVKDKNIYDEIDAIESQITKLEALKKRFKEEKKDDKKDKKDEKKGFGAIELFILATIASPFVFLFELWAYNFAMEYIKHMFH